MPIELECKLSVQGLDASRTRLRAKRADCVGRVLETNRFFDRPDGSLTAAGCGLRIREVRVLEGEGPRPSLTFKGPIQPAPYKKREEIEIAIDDVEKVSRLLHALGFVERLVFEKWRESWRLGSCSVELDELPRLGRFVEVEGPNDEAISSVLAALELSAAERVPDSYVALVAGLRPAGGPDPFLLRFTTDFHSS